MQSLSYQLVNSNYTEFEPVLNNILRRNLKNIMVIKLLNPLPNTNAKVEGIIYIGFEDNIPVLYIRNKEILLSKKECEIKGVSDFLRIKQYYKYYVLTPEEIKELKAEYL